MSRDGEVNCIGVKVFRTLCLASMLVGHLQLIKLLAVLENVTSLRGKLSPYNIIESKLEFENK